MTKKTKGISIKNENKVNIHIHTEKKTKRKKRTTKPKATVAYKNPLYQQSGGISYYGGGGGGNLPPSVINKGEYKKDSFIVDLTKTNETPTVKVEPITPAKKLAVKEEEEHEDDADDGEDYHKFNKRQMIRMLIEHGIPAKPAMKRSVLIGLIKQNSVSMSSPPQLPAISPPNLRSKASSIEEDDDDDEEDIPVSVRSRTSTSSEENRGFLEVFSNNEDREVSSPYSNSGSLHMSHLDPPSAVGGGGGSHAFQDQNTLNQTGFSQSFLTPNTSPKKAEPKDEVVVVADEEEEYDEPIIAPVLAAQDAIVPEEHPVHNLKALTGAGVKEPNPYPKGQSAWYKDALGIPQDQKVKKDRLIELHDEQFPKPVKQIKVKSKLKEVAVPDNLPPLKKATMKTAKIKEMHFPETAPVHENFESQEPSGPSLTEIASGKRGSRSESFKAAVSQSSGANHSLLKGFGRVQQDPDSQERLGRIFERRENEFIHQASQSEGHPRAINGLFMQSRDADEDPYNYKTDRARDVRNSFL